jgi:hypothetical protein
MYALIFFFFFLKQGKIPYLGIVNVVNFIKHHKFHITNQISALVQHASQDFCCQNQAASFGVHLNIPREDSNGLGVKGLSEIAKFLIRQGLDRGSVYASDNQTQFLGTRLIDSIVKYLVMWRRARATAYSATTVFPAEVWAATKTESPISR